MSIASEISRLQGAKADLKTAIEGKGVTVSDATKLDGYADLVDAIPQGGGSTLITKNISANGTYNASSDSADGYSSVTVAVPASAVDSGTKNITANGNNQDVVGYAAVNVAVPNSYSAADEGKVVSNGALVAQTAHADVTPTTSDQTIDTTTNNSTKVKGDADLVASNIKKDVEIFGVTGSYEGGGGGVSLDDFMSRTAPTGAISLPNTTTLYGYAFYNDSVMTSISAPSITRLGIYDFGKCTNLVNVYMPELIYAYLTDKADGATVSNSDSCYAFFECHSLGNVNLPKLQTAGYGLFYRAGYGQSVYNAVIVLPAISLLGNTAFRQGKFKAVDLGPNLQKIWNDSFYQGTYDVVILRSTTLVAANTRGAVQNITTLYVPAALVSDYATASNWSADAANRTVYAIEGSQYEHYYADGTAIPT